MRGFLRALFVVSAAVPGPLWADLIGQDDKGFQEALSLWLAGDEETSLTILSTLAREGNGAAQVVLGTIDGTPALQGDWVSGLSREDRIKLLRSPGGLSGESWLLVAASHEPLADAWVALRSTDATPELILTFARLSEPRAARVAGMTLAARQVRGFARVANDPAFPKTLLGYAINELMTSDPAHATKMLGSIEEGDPQRALFGPMVPADEHLIDWLRRNLEGDALVSLCETVCESEPSDTCLASAYAALLGYHELMALGSPFEALVDSRTFNRTPKGVEVSLRRLPMRPVPSECLTRLIVR